MPFKELKALIKKMSKMIPSMNKDDAKFLEGFKNSLKELVLVTKKVLDGEKNKENEGHLNSFDAAELSKKYEKFVEISGNVVADLKRNDLEDQQLKSLIIPLSNIVVPLSHYAEALKNPGEKSLSAILKDVSWIPKLLGEDADSLSKVKDEAPAREAKGFEQIQDVEKSTKLYKLLTDEAEQKYQSHYSKLLGSDDIMGSLEYKCNLIGSALEEKYGEGYGTQQIKMYSQGFERVEEAFSKDKQKELKTIEPLNQRKFEYLGMIYDPPSFERGATENGFSEDDIKIVHNFLSKLNPRSNLIGISPETLEALGQSSLLMTQVSDIKDAFNIKIGMRKKILGLKLPELKGLSDAIKNFEQKVYNYSVKGEGEAPKEKDVEQMLGALSNYLNSDIDLSDPGKIGLASACFNMANTLNECVTGFENQIAQIKETFDTKIRQEFDKRSEQIKFDSSDNTLDHMEKMWDILNSGANISNEEYDKVYKIALLRDSSFRNRQLDFAKHQLQLISERGTFLQADMDFCPITQESWKTLSQNEIIKKIGQVVAVCEFASEQEEKMLQNSEARKNGKVEALAKSYNQPLFECLTAEKVEEEHIQGLEQIIDDINNNPKLNEVLNSDPMIAAKVLTNPDRKSLDSILHGGTKVTFPGMTKQSLESLMSSVKAHNNSESYKAIGESIERLKNAEQNIGGVKTEDYIGVFQATMTYVNIHDSNPVRDWGKERFDNAAMLMANMGCKLAKDCPEMREEIEKAIKLTMIRSEKFRTYLTNKLATDNTIEPKFKKEMFLSAAIAETVLKEEFGKTMIEGNPSKQKDAYKYMEIFDKVYEGDKAMDMRYANRKMEEAPQKADNSMVMQ